MRTVNYLDGHKEHLHEVRVTVFRQDLEEMPMGITKIVVEAEILVNPADDVKEEAQRYVLLHTGGRWTDDSITKIDVEILS